MLHQPSYMMFSMTSLERFLYARSNQLHKHQGLYMGSLLSLPIKSFWLFAKSFQSERETFHFSQLKGAGMRYIGEKTLLPAQE